MKRRVFIKHSLILGSISLMPSFMSAEMMGEMDFRSVEDGFLFGSDECLVCGMNLRKFYKTSHAADVDGKTRQYCSISCMFDDAKDKPINPQVVDSKNLNFIDATKAFYVYGSNKPATMAKLSSYAFSSKSDAVEFRDEFGGEILNYAKISEIFLNSDERKLRQKREKHSHHMNH